MEPRIQYAKTSDGVNLAYYIRGDGPGLIHMPAVPFGHIHMDSQSAEMRGWTEGLSARNTLVRYASRGIGLSDRNVSNVSLETMVADLETIIDHLELPKCTVLGYTNSAPTAIAYSARHPERVSHLILWCGYAKASQLRSPRARALRQLLDSDWEMYTESVAHYLLGYPEGEQSHWFASLYRDNVTQDVARAYVDAFRELDVTELLPSVTAPTLILHRREVPWPDLTVAGGLASRLPNARLVLIEGRSGVPFIEKTDAVLAAIADFLDQAPVLVRSASDKSGTFPSGTAVILFADIADSTALTESLGDAAFRAKARELDGALRAVIREHAGTPIEGKLLGDGVLAVFGSARQAIEAALACATAGNNAGLPLHLGLHAGDVIRESDADGRSNVYGGAVNIASRISGLSAPGEILVSDTVRSLARTSAGVRFEDRGEQALKGVGEAVRVWAVRPQETSQ